MTINQKIMKLLLLICVIFSTCCIMHGQVPDDESMPDNDCLSILKESVRFYQEGQYNKCITDLESVLATCELSKSDKLQTMELLAKAYIETGAVEKADATVNLMLRNFPHYELNEDQNYESYNRLVKKYKVHPKFSIGIRNSANWITYKQTKVFSVLEGLDYSVPYNTYQFGLLQEYYYYGWAEFEFDKDISLNGDLTFVLAKYSRNFTQAPSFNLYFGETDNILEIPVYLKKYFHIGRNVLPYVTAGMGWLYMLSARCDVDISYTKDDIITTGKDINFQSREDNINVLEMRNRSFFEWIAGVGIGYKLKNLRLFIDARYYHGLKSINNEEKRFSNDRLINDYFYIDNSMIINQFELGASVSYTLFNSVKKARR